MLKILQDSGLNFSDIKKNNNQLIILSEAYYRFTPNFNDKWKNVKLQSGPKMKLSQPGWLNKINKYEKLIIMV